VTKLIFITGGVMSGLGKGMVTCSTGKMLQIRGFRVDAIKIDPYLNVDAGTMNPYIHGEVYVLDDGYEADMDLGAYERFLGLRLSRGNNITTGQIYQEVIRMEREGKYLGRCVQIIPHITDEIKKRIRRVAKTSNPDVLLIECGGTVGDIEGAPFLEAFRQMRIEEKREDTLLIHVTLVPVLKAVGELKTKPTQHSVRELREIGLQPDIIVARCEEGLVDREARRKIALYSNVEERAVFTSYDIEPIYQLPKALDKQGMGDLVCSYLGLNNRQPEWKEWDTIVNAFLDLKESVRIAMCGKYAELADSYVSINEALKHAGAICRAKVKIDWIETEKFEKDPRRVEELKSYDGILIPGGFGVRGTEGKIISIQYARENNIPFLGICFGFQLAVVEFTRHILGFNNAHSIECDPNTSIPVINLLPDQKDIKELGGTMRLGLHKIIVKEGTLAKRLYKADEIYERHRHRYEVNPQHWKALEDKDLIFSGWSPDGRRKEILEISELYFFLATQFHPEFRSQPGTPDPAYYGFIKAALDHTKGKSKPEFETLPRERVKA
jgi:CTP synthase